MHYSISILILFLSFSLNCVCQSELSVNQVDAQGRKQGHWIKKYPGGAVQYEGIFKDDHPVGEFRRYFNDSRLMSVLVYSEDGSEADATIYHPNGFIASRGKYVNQLKEGKWKFYSAEQEGYLVNEEEYANNIRNGLSVKFYPDGTVAEKLTYINGRREGEWIRYFGSGRIFIRSFYKNDMLNGKFDVWFENGSKQFTGTYINNVREGTWLIGDENGNLIYKMDYVHGVTNDRQLERDHSDYLDNLEKNAGKIPDPEKTGEIR